MRLDVVRRDVSVLFLCFKPLQDSRGKRRKFSPEEVSDTQKKSGYPEGLPHQKNIIRDKMSRLNDDLGLFV